ncbi:MAG TPA: Gfo/Idh/MocA family oxidoreductase, partial [Acidimicrobiales bacterium]|nr:Gfo/Idh/MocA family oxidoreductase [Acidimicrobiales bacterium]
HYRYHPLVERMVAILRSGEIGDIRHIETRLCVPYMKKGDIRYRLDLAGGATMDVGCYAIHLLRTLAGSEPKVVSARAKLSSPKVDRWMQAEFNLPGGATGKMTCALFSASLISTGAKVIGSKGEMSAINTTAPHIFHRLTIKTPNAKRTEKLDRHSTYSYQLRAFADAVLDGKPVLTPPSDSIANMEVIDAVYEQSGLGKRPTWTGSST